MQNSDIGLYGLGVMGQSLAINMVNHGYKVSVFNKTTSRVDNFVKEKAKSLENIIPTYSLKEFIDSLEKPRKVFLMIKAGHPVDDVIKTLIPLMEAGDVILDGGNSFYKDTTRRFNWLKDLGIHFLGVGISGGEEGALKGPSIMPGGSIAGWEMVKSILTDISAKNEDSAPCCNYIGSDGAGHYVKMVHNGIEYADMELIIEAYYLMKTLLGMTPCEMKKVFTKWNQEELNSYLIEITADILGKIDEKTDKPLVDVILDVAKQKGTGKWTSQAGLELGVSIPSITEAVFARYMSSIKNQRQEASKVLKGPDIKFEGDKETFIEDIKKALYASKICCYAQGFSLIKEASNEFNWNLDYGEISLLWRKGCIIRAEFLNSIKEAFDEDPQLDNLLLNPVFKQIIQESQDSWRRVVSLAVLNGIAIPGFSSSLSYYDSYRSDLLPANLLQAQRDYFGAHTYERIDEEGIFHTEWKN